MAGIVAQAPVKVASEVVGKTTHLLQTDGEILPGHGLASGVLALTLAILCFLGVLAFHFPQYLTTPELRAKYDVGVIRQIMLGALLIAGGWSLANVARKLSRGVNGAALLLVLATVALGGSRVPVGDFADGTPYLGLDWLILDLLGSSIIFIALEKIFPLYKGQAIFRKAWQNDLVHFGVNHLLIGFMLLVVNYVIHNVFGWMARDTLQDVVSGIWFVPQLLLCVFVADFVEYWVHRAYHEVPYLWKFHAVHHSSEVMDWIAGSRLHMFEIIATRVLILGALYVVGFSKPVLDAYIIVVGFQAVFNHANVHINWGPLRKVFVTPDFHHWHHSSDDEAIDKNYAAHFSFIDWMFGTAVDSEKRFPQKYGVVGDYVPNGFLKQQAFPFKPLVSARQVDGDDRKR
ncbi:sterol desaturase family protein [Herbaspirillum sp. Sphag1AN]|uniref:sterol desaturase family protein n=1 Tax=unclassified Herbaspirillum TaxID=2624150 RepID=UPI00351C54AA